MRLKYSKYITVLILSLTFAAPVFSQNLIPLKNPSVKAVASSSAISPSDEVFLEDLQRRAFQFFWEHSDPGTGLTLDRAHTDGTTVPPTDGGYHIASIASTGFALSGYCTAADRAWITPAEARDRTRTTLDFFANRAPQQNGWFYHWMDAATGERRWTSEISSIDTALLLGGVLTVRQCFADDAQIVALATQIYLRVDFTWMLNGHPFLLAHGWRPETGWIPYRWDTYSEDLLLYVLAIASPTHGISPRAWYAWTRTWTVYGDYKYLAAVSPLFIHQYSHAWIDFRGRREHRPPYVDYFKNSVAATYAQRQFFIDVLSLDFPQYSGSMWGLTASDSANGYVGWGAPPRHPATDGSVVPCAAAGSLMFAPEITLPTLQEMKTRFGASVYGRYGFADAFNPHNGWVDADVIGIDLGITLLSAENLRSGKNWFWFMQNSEVRQALRRISLI